MILNSQIKSRFARLFARSMAAYAIVGGGVTLIGWFAQLPRLTDWDGDGIAMFANAAVMAMCAGTSLILLTTTRRWAVATSRSLATIVVLLGAATLFQHITGINLAIDTLLVREPWGIRAAVAPGRVGPPAATSFTLLGLALVMATGGDRFRRFVPGVGIGVSVIATLPLLGFLFDADPLFAFARFTGIALQTVTVIMALAIGILAVVPERHPMRVLCEDSAAGMLTRRLLAFAIALPAALGWLSLRGQEAGLYDLRMGTALLVLALVIALCALLSWCVAMIREREVAVAKYAQEQAALYQFTDKLHRAGPLPEVFEGALDCLVGVLDCDRASILLFDEAGVMRFVGWRGLSEDYRKAVEGHSPWKPEDMDPKPICIDDIANSDLPNSLRSVVQAEGICALAFIPVIASGKLAGKFMAYYNEPHSFRAAELDFALAIARQLGFGIERQHAEDQLRDAVHRAEEASRAKDSFLAALSHELRTPLNPALMMAAALEDEISLPADVREQLAMITRNIRTEVRLIDDLLDLTRISHGKLKLQQVTTDLHDILDRAEETVSKDAQVKGIAIRLALDAREYCVHGDPTRLQQVFWNLLKNAVKFTPTGGTVTIRSLNPAPGRVAVLVQDTGIGIESQTLNTIFVAFDQGGLGGRHEFGGLGLGLSISKAIVDLHRGELRAQSEGRGKGAHFTVELATVTALSAVAHSGAPIAPIPKPRRILVVEDHEPSLAAMLGLLERDGHKVFGASTVNQALEKASSCQCDVVISDLQLPDGTGFELMSKIRRLHGWPGIAVSAYGMEADLRLSAESGFSKHLVKPVDVWQLREALGEITDIPSVADSTESIFTSLPMAAANQGAA